MVYYICSRECRGRFKAVPYLQSGDLTTAIKGRLTASITRPGARIFMVRPGETIELISCSKGNRRTASARNAKANLWRCVNLVKTGVESICTSRAASVELEQRVEYLPPADDADDPVARNDGKAAVGPVQKHFGYGGNVGVGANGNN